MPFWTIILPSLLTLGGVVANDALLKAELTARTAPGPTSTQAHMAVVVSMMTAELQPNARLAQRIIKMQLRTGEFMQRKQYL